MITAVVDTSVLSGFARARRLDVLALLVTDMKVVTTSEVLDELREGTDQGPLLAHALTLPWIEEVYLRGLPAMNLFAAYARRLGSGPRNIGEATVLAWAELHHATAVLDDKDARRVARERGVELHGTLWLIAHGIARGRLSMPQASQLIDDLQATGMFLPCSGADFPAWAHQKGLFAAASFDTREPPSDRPRLKS